MSLRDRLELLLLAAIWGASFLFMRVAAPEFGPLALIEIRVAIAAVFLAGVLACRGGFGRLAGRALPLTFVGAINSALAGRTKASRSRRLAEISPRSRVACTTAG